MNTGRRRDSAIEDLLAAGLRSAAGRPEDCPAAEDLAAFVEGGLPAGERSAIESHAVSCDRCQQTLALIGAQPPAPVPAAARTAHGLFVPRLRWLLPASVAAAAVIVYLAVVPARGPQRTVTPPQPVQVAEADRQRSMEPAAGEVPRGSASARLDKAGEIAAAPSPHANAAAATPPEPARRKRPAPGEPSRQASAVLPPAPSAPPVVDQMAERVMVAPPEAKPAQAVQMKADAAVGAPAAALQAPAPQQQVAQQAQYGRAESTTRAAGAAQQARVADEASKARPVDVKGMNESVFVAEATAPAPRVVSAPGGTIRWRLESGGRILRSHDSGATFELQYRAASDLLAASAPAPSTCWAVGRAGLVLLTTDGIRWQSRPFPERVDLVAVDARDALHAVVTARDGRKFLTEDGGATWAGAR